MEGDFSLAGGSRAAETLLRREPRPTAVFCANDLMAIGFIAKATQMGFSIPSDVSVAGYDGIDFGAYAQPTLTTVATAPHSLGEHAARTLLGDGGRRTGLARRDRAHQAGRPGVDRSGRLTPRCSRPGAQALRTASRSSCASETFW